MCGSSQLSTIWLYIIYCPFKRWLWQHHYMHKPIQTRQHNIICLLCISLYTQAYNMWNCLQKHAVSILLIIPTFCVQILNFMISTYINYMLQWWIPACISWHSNVCSVNSINYHNVQLWMPVNCHTTWIVKISNRAWSYRIL